MNAERIFSSQECDIEVLSLERGEDSVREKFIRNALLPIRLAGVKIKHGKYYYEPSSKYMKIYWLNRKK